MVYIYINGLEVDLVSVKSKVKDRYPLFFLNKTRLKTNALATELKGLPTSSGRMAVLTKASYINP